MGVQRDRVTAYRAALASTGAKEFRMPMSTKDAIALAAELEEAEVRHPAAVVAGLAALQNIGQSPEKDDSEGVMRFFNELSKAATIFWDGFEGQTVDGVEIIRRR
jgi:hypothetical protein